ncbi:hypothetical protein V7S43_001402 [Phytophthora oleae]|uniref:Uncharacterized protein n=1 Tax=Phytophthora oleae TaxID=2107226 RepID=A0ABD3G6U0_9STRA
MKPPVLRKDQSWPLIIQQITCCYAAIIMAFSAAIQRDTELQASQRRPCTFHEVADVITFLRDSSLKPPPPFALDMFVGAREEFYGGWVLWLGNQEAATITPELRARVPSMRSETKARFLFRLSQWTRSNNSRPGNTESFDIT